LERQLQAGSTDLFVARTVLRAKRTHKAALEAVEKGLPLVELMVKFGGKRDRLEAVEFLEFLGRQDPRARAALRRLAEDPEADVRHAARMALAGMEKK